MKVVIVLPYLTSIGGAARYGWELCEFLTNQKDQVILASLYTDKNLYKEKDFTIINLADPSFFPQTIKFWFFLSKITKRLSRLISKEKPDAVLFINFPTPMWIADYEIPTFYYPQDIQMLYSNTYTRNLSTSKNLFWKLIRVFIRIYEKKKWNYFDQVICPSKFTAKHVDKIYGVKSVVIYPGTNTNVFKPSASLQKQKAVLCMGDIRPRHADFLITAANFLCKKRNDFKIWIVGNKGDYDIELRNLVKKYNLEKKIELFGRVSDSKLVKLYSEALMVTHLVKDASFGLIVTEAMSCETPVISWIPGGPEESIIHGETGFLIEKENLDDLIKHIELLLNDPNLAITMGKKARIRVKELFESSEKYYELIEFIKKRTLASKIRK